MMRVALLVLFAAALPAAAETALSESRNAEIRQQADRLAGAEVAVAPELLVQAFLALEAVDGERPMAEQLAGMSLGAMPTLERKAAVAALAAELRARLAPPEIARLYAGRAYFGRNCRGWRAAAEGIAGLAPEAVDEATILALAALPRSPSLYLGDRSALKERTALIVQALARTGRSGTAEARRLLRLPTARLGSGRGC